MSPQPFVAHSSVVAIDICVLLGLLWLNVRWGNLVLESPFYHRFTDIFCAIIHTYHRWLSAPLDTLLHRTHDLR
ncbi:MAG: hypothetical protein ACI9RO_001741 [Alteromonas macleodii]|jgi:hypothetical protein